jgi:abortive infection bacteriophage resistance protein
LKPTFNKPPLLIPAQRELLSKRGLAVADAARVEHYLNFIGYFRLSGYLRFYVDPTDPNGERFVQGAKFQDGLDLYVFDRKLRVLLLDALERIEISIKSTMTNVGSISDGAMWLCNPKNFDHGRHGEIEAILKECLGDDPETINIRSLLSFVLSTQTRIRRVGCLWRRFHLERSQKSTNSPRVIFVKK